MAQGIVFNSNADNQDVVSEIKAICNTDTNSYPLKDMARRVNFALDRFFTLAFQADGQWAYDDTNHGTDPIQTINLVSGTQSYDLGSFTSEIINILRIEALNSVGDAVLLRRLERSNLGVGPYWAGLGGIALTEYQPTAGEPFEYDLVGESIFLYPKPNFSATDGLKIYLERNKKTIVSTDTSVAMPVPSIFSQYICLLASLPFLIENKKDQKNDVAAQIAQYEIAIKDYFGNREKGIHKHMTMNIRRYR